VKDEFYESSPGCILSRSQLFCNIKCDPADSIRIMRMLYASQDKPDMEMLRADLKVFIEHVEASVSDQHLLRKKANFMKRYLHEQSK